MGGSSSSSSVTHNINTNIVNRNDFNALNENLTNIAVSAIVENAKSCSAGSGSDQTLDLHNATAQCINISGLTMSQKSSLDLTCVQATQVQTEIMDKMSDSIVAQMKSKMKDDVFAKVTTMASTAAQTGAISMPFGKGSDSSSSVKLIQNTNVNNTTEQNLNNVVKTCINQSFTTKNILSCSANLSQEQIINLSGARTTGCINLSNINMDEASTIVAKCIQTSKNVNDVINNVAHNTGMAIEGEDETAAKTDVTTVSKSSAKQIGVIGALGSLFSGLLSGFLPIICLIACVLIVVIFVAPKLLGGGEDEDE